MSGDYPRPVRLPGEAFDLLRGGDDPAVTHRIAHDTAWALLARVRAGQDAEVVDRVVAFADSQGLEAIAELWAQAPATSLAGALWRLYLLRRLVVADAEGTSLVYRRGTEVIGSADPVIAGAVSPTGPEEMMALVDLILRGVFDGDLGIALDRASSYCRIMAAGNASLADDREGMDEEGGSALTRRALRYDQFAGDLRSVAQLWRHGTLG